MTSYKNSTEICSVSTVANQFYPFLIYLFRLMSLSYYFSQLNDLHKRRLEEATRLQEIKHEEEKAWELARQERGRCEAAIQKAECLRECAKREASQRNEAEIKAMHDAKEKEKLEKAIAGSVQQYQEITWEEIVSGTLSFSEELKIGMGAYGTVYKCNLHHTTTAVKVLHSKEEKNSKQFQQEVCKLLRLIKTVNFTNTRTNLHFKMFH